MVQKTQRLRAQLNRHLDGLEELDELSDERYHTTHERFESASNQREQILQWFERFIAENNSPDNRHFELLSVGCGGGVMDRKIAEVFAASNGSVELTGVDPNPEHITAFESIFSNSPHRVHTYTGSFDDFQTDRRFDVVYFLHCLYYFDQIEPALARAADCVRPGGSVVVLQAPNDDLNHLADKVWHKQFDQSAWFSDDIHQVLQSMDGETRCKRIEASVDVTACFEHECTAGTELLDFIVQADTRRFSSAFRRTILDSLRAICKPAKGGLRVAHPVDAMVYTPQH